MLGISWHKNFKNIKAMRTFLYTLLFVFVSEVGFSQIIQLSESKMIQTSDNIIKGTVFSSKSEWTADKSYIFTFTRLVVDEVFTGDHIIGDTITIVAPGGYDPVTDIGLVVSHQAVFEPGEETIVFLKRADGYIDAVDYRVLKNDSRFPARLERVNSYHLGKRKIVRGDAANPSLIVDPNLRRTLELEKHNIELRNEIKRLENRTPVRK